MNIVKYSQIKFYFSKTSKPILVFLLAFFVLAVLGLSALSPLSAEAQSITFAGQEKNKAPVSFDTEIFRLSPPSSSEQPLNLSQELSLATNQIETQPEILTENAATNATLGKSFNANDIHESRDIVLLLWLTPAADHYAYANDPGEGGLPTKVVLRAPGQPGDLGNINRPTPRGEVIYPLGKQVADIYSDGKQVNVYNERTAIYIYLPGIIPVTPLMQQPAGLLGESLQGGPEEFPPDVSIDLEISLLLCSSKNCTPVKKTMNVLIPGQKLVQALPVAQEQAWWDDFSQARSIIYNTPPDMAPVYDSPVLEIQSLGKALVLGFIAGLILNFMPCVFPVVSLKLLSFMITLGQPDSAVRIRDFRRQNAMFALGVITWFTLLSGILAAMDLLWGQIFQSQGMVIVMLLLVFALTLSLFGLFMLPSFAFREKQGRVTKRSAFITGMLATCLATPCSGPLLGGVLGWSFNQAQPILGLVFLAVGLGMASPYLMLAIFPELGRYFPKPGRWLARLELLLGFFLMLTCAYLFTLLTQEIRIWAVVAMLVLFVVGWLWGRHQIKQGYGGIFFWRWLLGCLGALVVFLLVWQYVFYSQEQGNWEPYSRESFMALQGQKNIVLDFTADWCPNCKLLERTVFTAERMQDWRVRYDVVFMQVDLTSHNPEGYEFLNALGSSSIPVVALFPKQENAEGQLTPLVLRDLFGPEGLEEAAEKIWGVPKH